jgi:ubiquinone/menaquinone biosynthesis C-methylase UbiE
LAQKVKQYEAWWDDHVANGKYYTIEQFKTILSNCDSRRAYLNVVNNGDRVLDVGCGLGLDYAYYIKNNVVVDYTGIDICKGFIKYCRDMYPEGSFEVQPSYETTFKDKSFGIATARHVLEHLKEPYTTLSEMCRVAKQVAIIWFLPPGEEKIRLTKKGFYKNVYSVDKLKEHIDSLGFNILVEDIPIESKRKHQLWHLTS